MSRNNNEKKTSKLNPFRWMERDGIGVEDDEPPIMDAPGVKNYFKLLWRKLNQIVSLNLLMIVCNFPILFAVIVLSGYFSIHSTSPTYSIFAQINGAMMHSQNAFTSAIIGTFGAQSNITVLSQVDNVLLILTFLVLFTFGPVMVGSTYILRSMVREEPVFLWHDFVSAVKKNIKQALVYGVLDLIIMALIAYDIVFFNINYAQSMATTMMFFASLVLAVLYTIMRMYIYPMMITFDLSIGKILKNALIFTVLGIKRNAVAILIVTLIGVLNFMLFGVFLPLGIMLPFVITFSLITYTGVYFAYPVIYKYMIEPYYTKDGTPKSKAAAGADNISEALASGESDSSFED